MSGGQPSGGVVTRHTEASAARVWVSPENRGVLPMAESQELRLESPAAQEVLRQGLRHKVGRFGGLLAPGVKARSWMQCGAGVAGTWLCLS